MSTNLGTKFRAEHALFDQRSLLAERLPGQVDAPLSGLEVGVRAVTAVVTTAILQ